MAVDLTARVVTGAHRDISIGDAARVLAADVDVDLAARRLTDEIMSEVWPTLDDPSFREAVLCSTRDNLDAIFAVMSGTAPVDEPPAAAMEFAEVTARMGLPVAEVDKAYRVGVASLWTMWFDAAREHGGDIDEMLCGPTLAMYAHVDRTLDAVAVRHQQVRDEMRRTTRELRRRTLMALLDGTADGDAEQLGRTLDYRLGGTHLALLVETPPGAGGGQPDGDLAALRAAVDSRDMLVLQHGARSWLVWFGRDGGFEPQRLKALTRALAATALTVAVGEPAPGIAGLRRTRRQALETARVQRAFGATGHRVLWARDVRLETLLLGDEERARDFIADELGGLAAGDPTTARLRETLLAWLATGSHVSAAAMLGVHENTVRNRIRAAEELLGAPLLGRRTELQVALRLERVLNAPREGEVSAAA